jgi:TrmH family RNA methyltransferase
MAPRVEPLRPAELRALRALTRRSVRARRAEFLLEGFRAVEYALRIPERISLVTLSPDAIDHPRATALIDRCAVAGVLVRSGSPEILAELSDSVSPPGIMAQIAWEPHRKPDTGEITQELGCHSCRRLLCLDGVSDPGNVGTLMRTAEAFGMDGIILGKGSVEATNPKVVRSAVGSLFRLDYVAEGVELADLLSSLQDQGWQVFRAEVASGRPPAPARAPWALVIGNEAHGVSEAVQTIGTPIHIPMVDATESLNAGVAGSILLYELTRDAAERAGSGA